MRAAAHGTGDGLACKAPNGSWSIMYFGGAT
jgi:hypothetical protein